MSIRLLTADSLLYRATSVPGAGTPYTAMAWIYITTDMNTGAVIAQLIDSTYAVFQGAGLYAVDGTTLCAYTASGATTGTNLSTGTWYHVTYVRSGATHTVYLDAVSNAVRTANITLTPAYVMYGGNGATALNGRLAYIKSWTAELSATEIAIERIYAKAQRTADLHEEHLTWSGATARLADTSGNSRTFTAIGTLADEDDPTVPTTTGDAGTFSESATVTETGVIALTDSATFSESTAIDSTALADDGFFDDVATVTVGFAVVLNARMAKCLRVA